MRFTSFSGAFAVMGLAAALACGEAEPVGCEDPSPDIAGPTTAGEEHSYRVVRVDPETFMETELGTVAIDPQPPFLATVIGGGNELRRIVDEQNELEFVSSAGLDDRPGRTISRSSPEFLSIMRDGWLAQMHHVSLRTPASESRTPVRRQLFARDGDAYELLGVVEFGDNDYVRIVRGPRTERKRLGELLHEMNDEWSLENGVRRGTAEYRASQRDELLGEGFVLLADDVAPPRRVTTETRPWLSVDVSGGLVVIPTSDGTSLHLSGPPSGPSSILVLQYSGVGYDVAALRDWVTTQHGTAPGFVTGPVGEVEIAERELLAMSFRTGAGSTAANHVAVLWPEPSGSDARPRPSDAGVAVVVTARGRQARAAEDVLGAPNLAPVLHSLWIDFDRI